MGLLLFLRMPLKQRAESKGISTPFSHSRFRECVARKWPHKGRISAETSTGKGGKVQGEEKLSLAFYVLLYSLYSKIAHDRGHHGTSGYLPRGRHIV